MAKKDAVVSVEDVRHVATLARLGVTDARAAELARELNTILEHMDALARVDTNGVAEYSQHSQTGHHTQLRADAGPPIALSGSIGSFAPESRDGLLLVPRLATHEDAGE